MSAFPIFLKLEGKRVLVVGAGKVAREKAAGLIQAGARVRVVAPSLGEFLGADECFAREFCDEDIQGAWLVVAAATPDVNRAVRAAADKRNVFVIAVDDVANCSAFGAARIARGPITIALSSDGRAPALVALLRQAIEAVIPHEIDAWRETAERARSDHRAAGVPMQARRPLLLRALNALYGAS